jgi:formamidopyrimidine-DNA glycosylase
MKPRPELPAVEVFRRYLNATGLHKPITAIEVHNSKVLESVSGSQLKKALKGCALETSFRHGKYLFGRLDSGEYLVLH